VLQQFCWIEDRGSRVDYTCNRDGDVDIYATNDFLNYERFSLGPNVRDLDLSLIFCLVGEDLGLSLSNVRHFLTYTSTYIR
jgi:hypothetical protein